MKNLARAAITLLLTLALAPPADAVMIGMSTEALTREADVVVEGSVGAVRSFWNAEHTKILSRAEVAVGEVVRGTSAGSTVVVEYEGGEVGGLGMRVSDVEPFAAGERVLLFLKRLPQPAPGTEAHGLVGLAQGKYVIGRDRVARKGGFSVAAGAGDVDGALDLDALKAKIRGVR
jgi:hypothetical protein